MEVKDSQSFNWISEFMVSLWHICSNVKGAQVVISLHGGRRGRSDVLAMLAAPNSVFREQWNPANGELTYGRLAAMFEAFICEDSLYS